MDRLVRIMALMITVWVGMLILIVAIDKFIAPIEYLPPPLDHALALSIIKLALSSSIALAWLYLWHLLVKLYRRRMLRSRI